MGEVFKTDKCLKISYSEYLEDCSRFKRCTCVRERHREVSVRLQRGSALLYSMSDGSVTVISSHDILQNRFNYRTVCVRFSSIDGSCDVNSFNGCAGVVKHLN